jgi:raffinose/stachyose/melibiose transport system substrate-binding protein
MSARHLRSRLARRHQLATSIAVGAVLAAAITGVVSAATTANHSAPSGTLNFIISSAPGSDAGFEAVNAAFEKAYPGVKVNFSAIPNADYAAAEASRLTAGGVDILGAAPTEVPSYATGAEGNDALLADSGALVNITGQSFLKRFTVSILNALQYKGKTYTVPTGLSYYTGVYYNKAIFAKYHLSVPTTWTQFVALCRKLQAHHVTPLGIGGKDTWPAGLPMQAAVNGQYPTKAAKQAIARSFWQRRAKTTDPKNLKVLQIEKALFGFTLKNFAGVPYNDMPGLFAAGKFAMTPDGTWNNVTILTAVGSNFGVGYFPLPTSNNPKANALLNGKVELRLAIASSGKNRNAALAYLDFFSQPANYKLFLSHAGFAPAEPNIPTSPFLNSISKYTKSFQPAWDTVWTINPKAGAAALWPFNYADLSPLGTMTVNQAAIAAQKAWDAGF